MSRTVSLSVVSSVSKSSALYQLARRLAEVPSLHLVAPIKNVAVASLSLLRNEPARYRAVGC